MSSTKATSLVQQEYKTNNKRLNGAGQHSEKNKKHAQLGVPHSRIQVELGFILQAGTCQILNFAQNPRQSHSVQDTELNGGDTAQKK